LKMELIQGSETSANYNLTPGKYPEENIQTQGYLLSQILTQMSLFISDHIFYSRLTPKFDPDEVTAFDRDLKLTANRINRK